MFNPLHTSPLFIAVKQYEDERDPTKLGERSQAILRILFNNGDPLKPQQVLAIWRQVPNLHLQEDRLSAVERLFQGYLPRPIGYAGPLPILPQGASFFAPRSIQPPLHGETPVSTTSSSSSSLETVVLHLN